MQVREEGVFRRAAAALIYLDYVVALSCLSEVNMYQETSRWCFSFVTVEPTPRGLAARNGSTTVESRPLFPATVANNHPR